MSDLSTMAAAARYVALDLPDGRWAELIGPDAIEGPLKGMADLSSARLSHCPAILDTETDRVVGYWPIFQAVHAEPLFLDPSVRNNIGVAKALIGLVLSILQADQIPYVFGIIADEEAAVNGSLAETFGFAKIPGQLYACRVPGVVPTEDDA